MFGSVPHDRSPRDFPTAVRAGTRAFDVILAGAGLANCLIALRLLAVRPRLRVALVDSRARPAGDHTWSFHDDDVSPATHAWLEPLLFASWPAQEVRFADHVRVLRQGYRSVRSDRLAAAVCAAVGELGLFLERTVLDVTDGEVTLDDGTRLRAPCVLDGRGLSGAAVEGERYARGYQKFVGLDLALEAPHGLAHPVIMDARVDQADGYRFFYCLPWSERTLLVEDTRYSTDPSLDEAALEAEVLRYAEAQGWRVRAIERRERGCLPIPTEPYRPRPRGPGEACAVGMRAGLFHAATGYSLPIAARLAEDLARLPLLTTFGAADVVSLRAEREAGATGFYLLLNRMLFEAARPVERHRVLSAFYRSPEPLVARFYAGGTTAFDRLRILRRGSGTVPLGRALSCLFRTTPRRRETEGALLETRHLAS